MVFAVCVLSGLLATALFVIVVLWIRLIDVAAECLQAEAELAARRKMYESLVTTVNDGVVRVNGALDAIEFKRVA